MVINKNLLSSSLIPNLRQHIAETIHSESYENLCNSLLHKWYLLTRKNSRGLVGVDEVRSNLCLLNFSIKVAAVPKLDITICDVKSVWLQEKFVKELEGLG